MVCLRLAASWPDVCSPRGMTLGPHRRRGLPPLVWARLSTGSCKPLTLGAPLPRGAEFGTRASQPSSSEVVRPTN